MDGRLSAWRPAVIHGLVSQCCCSPQVPMQRGVSYCRLTGLGLAARAIPRFTIRASRSGTCRSSSLASKEAPKTLSDRESSLKPLTTNMNVYPQPHSFQCDTVCILALSTSTFIHHDTNFDELDLPIFARFRSHRHECIGTSNTFNHTHQALHPPKHRDDLLPARSESSCPQRNHPKGYCGRGNHIQSRGSSSVVGKTRLTGGSCMGQHYASHEHRRCSKNFVGRSEGPRRCTLARGMG
jgi:hypothetical protein